MSLTVHRVQRTVCRTMSLLANLRRQPLRAPRLVAALIAVAWFGLAATPCQASMHTGHIGSSHHGSMPAGSCGHCPDATSGSDAPCATVIAGDCLTQGQAIMMRSQVDDLQPQAAPPPSFPDFDPVSPGISPSREARIRPTPVARASIQQRYCTYLK